MELEENECFRFLTVRAVTNEMDERAVAASLRFSRLFFT